SPRSIVRLLVVATDNHSMLLVAKGDGECSGRISATVERKFDCQTILASIVIGQQRRQQSARSAFASGDEYVTLRAEREDHGVAGGETAFAIACRTGVCFRNPTLFRNDREGRKSSVDRIPGEDPCI